MLLCQTKLLENMIWVCIFVIAAEDSHLSFTIGGISLTKAHNQHEIMCATLKQLISNVISLPSDGYADSVFIEDTAVIACGTAFVTRPGAVSRRGEVHRVQEYLSSHTSLRVVVQDTGTLDGGDVLFTGREFFVGLSHRTSRDGIAQLASAFPSYRVTVIDMTGYPTLHLKSACSMLCKDVVLVGGVFGSYIRSRIADASKIYQFVHVADEAAANVVTINDHVLHRCDSEYPHAGTIFASASKKFSLQCHPLLGSELAKVDGALTCCSLLI